MAGYSVGLPRYDYPDNALLNFQPLNNAISGFKDAQAQNALFDYKQQQDKIANAQAGARIGLAQQAGQREQTAFNQQQHAATAQAILALPPDQQPAALARAAASDPDWAKEAAQMGFRPDDYAGIAQAFVRKGLGAQNPLDVEAKRAQIGLIGAQTKAETQKAAIAQQQADLIGSLLSPAIAPQQPAPGAPPAQGAPMQPGALQQGQASPQTPAGLPRAGSPTAVTGAPMPSMQTTPGYYTDEDRQNMALGILAPRALSAIQQSPGHLQRAEAAKTVGKELGQLEERQRAGTQILGLLDHLGDTATSYGPQIEGAIGPYNTAPGAQMMKRLVPGNTSYDINNRLNHEIEGLVTSFVSSAARSGMQMSDARQKAFADTMGLMMKATSKPEFDKIVSDAKRIVSQTFQLPFSEDAASPSAAKGAPKYTAQNSMGHTIYSDDGKTWREAP